MAAPAIRPRTRWTPPAHGVVDFSHPLAAGLSFAQWAAGGKMVGFGPPGTASANAAQAVSPFGAAITSAADNSTVPYSWAKNDAVFLPATSTSGWSLVVVANITTVAVADTRWLINYETPFNASWRIFTHDGAITGGVNVSAGINYTDTSFAHTSGPAVFTMVFDPGNVFVYTNGVRKGSAIAATMMITGNTNPLMLGGAWNGSLSTTNQLSAAYVYQRALSPSEVAALAADPFQFIRY